MWSIGSLLRLFLKGSVFPEEMREDKSWAHLKEGFGNTVVFRFLKALLNLVEEFIAG